MADKQLIWSTLRYPESGIMLPAYYLENEYEPVAVRIHADSAPKVEAATIDIFDDGVSIFNDHEADSNNLSFNYLYQHVPNTTVGIEPEETDELMAEDFRDDLTLEAGSWITCKMYSDGGARNVTVILELNKITESDEDAD
jgi:hypothetical protein